MGKYKPNGNVVQVPLYNSITDDRYGLSNKTTYIVVMFHFRNQQQVLTTIYTILIFMIIRYV